MSVTERPLFGKVEIQRLTDVWTEKRRNMVLVPQATAYAGSGWAAAGGVLVSPGWIGATLNSPTTGYIFTDGAEEAIAPGDKVTMSVTYVVSALGTGSTATHVRAVPHIRTGNVYLPITLAELQAQNLLRPIVVGREEAVVIQWTADRAIAVGDLDIALTTAVNQGSFSTVTGGFSWRASRLTIERGHTPGGFFSGAVASTDPLVRNRWLGGINSSISVQETRRVNFIENATQLSYRRGGVRTGIGTKTDVGLMTFTLHNDEDPLDGGTFQPGQEVRAVAGQITPEKRTSYPAKTVYTEDFSTTLSPVLIHSMDFENGGGAWRDAGTPVVPVTDATAHSGSKLVRTTSGDYSNVSSNGISAAGSNVTVTAWVRPHQGGWRGYVSYGTGGGGGIADLAPNVWTKLSSTQFVTQDGNVYLYAYNSSSTGQGAVDWDDITIERGELRAQGVWSKVGTTADLYFYQGQMNVYQGVATAQATITDLEIGHPYTVTAKAVTFDGAGATTAAVGVVGKGTGAAIPVASGVVASPSYTFTATATSHTIQVVGGSDADLLWDDVKVTRNAWIHITPAVDNSAPIFTGRVVDVKSTYPLNKATGKERTSVTITVADAVNIHGSTMRYGVQIAEGFETFESRINRLASSALAPIEPPVQGAPKVVYSF